MGVSGVSKTFDGLKDMADNNVRPMEYLSSIAILNQRNSVLLQDMMLEPTPENLSARNGELTQNTGKIDKAWADYMATSLSDREKALVPKFVEVRKQYTDEGFNPLRQAALASQQELAQRIYKDKVRSLSIPLAAVLDELIDIQVRLADETYTQASRDKRSTSLLIVVATVVALALGGALSWFITHSITGPVAQAVAFSGEVAGGNLTARVDGTSKDELGHLLVSLRSMQDNLIAVVSRVRQGSESVSNASAEVAQGNQDLSARTESQASALEETAASMEELSSTVKQNAENARQANQLAQSASTVAVQGGEVVTQVVDTMRGISDSSRKIAEIINVIDGIAFQTNILALNAAVEAARAGEQGRGFAVVAGEVRSLAGRSAEAAKEIKQLISDSVTRVDQGTRLVDEAGAKMQDIVASIRRVTDIMAEISAASSEQSQGVAQIGEAVTNMDQTTQQNAALVEEMAAAAGSLRGHAQDLVQAVSVFKLGATPIHAAPVPVVRAPAAVPGTPPRARPQPVAVSRTAAHRPAAPAPSGKQLVKAGDDDGDWTSF
jgi:methyl-accepting chemotaxis protein-1 (serine sensor receptor)